MAELAHRVNGRGISSIRLVHDYLQSSLDDSAILNVFNKYAIEPYRDITCIVGHSITSVEESDTAIIFHLSDACVLTVGLADEDYRGPEALQYIGSNQTDVIVI
jgi:hypothetical protein